eukprot:TRINITY_DN2400_c0_g1_i2.p1 TRINITY_DN2400_c0_g1~~TRINITY_DN2400_c0_g1_i2.p1  ORF type:complete len:138 (-),score=9.70 TRINITY_DN2400_c0_g1_i2:46-459(-)
MKAAFVFALFLFLVQGKRLPEMFTRNSFQLAGVGKDIYILRVKAGHKFMIELTSNPTTGYSWIVTNPKKFRTLKFMSDTERGEQIVPKVPQGHVGAAGVQHFIFYPKRRGTEVVKLEYKRPWEKTPMTRYILRIKSQ